MLALVACIRADGNILSLGQIQRCLTVSKTLATCVCGVCDKVWCDVGVCTLDLITLTLEEEMRAYLKRSYSFHHAL